MKKQEYITAIKNFNKIRYQYLKQHKNLNKAFSIKPFLHKRRIIKELSDLYSFYVSLLYQPDFIDNSDMAYEVFMSYVRDVQLKYNITESDLKMLLLSVRDGFHEWNTI